jgi:hypothetical protein
MRKARETGGRENRVEFLIALNGELLSSQQRALHKKAGSRIDYLNYCYTLNYNVIKGLRFYILYALPCEELKVF